MSERQNDAEYEEFIKRRRIQNRDAQRRFRRVFCMQFGHYEAFVDVNRQETAEGSRNGLHEPQSSVCFTEWVVYR